MTPKKHYYCTPKKPNLSRFALEDFLGESGFTFKKRCPTQLRFACSVVGTYEKKP